MLPRPCLAIAGVSLHHGGGDRSARLRRLRIVSEGLLSCVNERAKLGDWNNSRGMVEVV